MIFKSITAVIFSKINFIIATLTGFFVKDIQNVKGNDDRYNFRRELVKIAVKFVFLSPIMYSMYIFCSSFISISKSDQLTSTELTKHFETMSDPQHLGMIFQYCFYIAGLIIVLYFVSLITDEIVGKISKKTINEGVEKVGDAIADKIKN